MLPTFSINIKYFFYLFKYSLQNIKFLYTKSLSDINDNDKIPVNEDNKGSINSEKDNGERFYEWLAGVIYGDGCFLLSKKGMLV